MTTGTATPLQMEAPSHAPAQTRDGSALGAPACWPLSSFLDRGRLLWRQYVTIKRTGQSDKQRVPLGRHAVMESLCLAVAQDPVSTLGIYRKPESIRDLAEVGDPRASALESVCPHCGGLGFASNFASLASEGGGGFGCGGCGHGRLFSAGSVAIRAEEIVDVASPLNLCRVAVATDRSVTAASWGLVGGRVGREAEGQLGVFEILLLLWSPFGEGFELCDFDSEVGFAECHNAIKIPNRFGLSTKKMCEAKNIFLANSVLNKPGSD